MCSIDINTHMQICIQMMPNESWFNQGLPQHSHELFTCNAQHLKNVTKMFAITKRELTTEGSIISSLPKILIYITVALLRVNIIFLIKY